MQKAPTGRRWDKKQRREQKGKVKALKAMKAEGRMNALKEGRIAKLLRLLVWWRAEAWLREQPT